jgi:hypothetical protein
MKKIFILGVIFSLQILALVYGQQTAPGSAYVSEAGRFSVKFPAKPQEKVEKINSADGVLDLYTFMVESGGNEYLVLYTDYNDPVTADEIHKIIAAVSEGGTKGTGGKVVSKKDITLKGNHGSSEVIETTDTVHLHNYYLVGQRLYQVIFTMPKGSQKPQDADVFLESFDIVVAK